MLVPVIVSSPDTTKFPGIVTVPSAAIIILSPLLSSSRIEKVLSDFEFIEKNPAPLVCKFKVEFVSVSVKSANVGELPIPSPKFVAAAPAVVAPVPPSATANVPVMELASNFTATAPDSNTKPPLAFNDTANSVESITSPLLALRSKLRVVPANSNPSPAEGVK